MPEATPRYIVQVQSYRDSLLTDLAVWHYTADSAIRAADNLVAGGSFRAHVLDSVDRRLIVHDTAGVAVGKHETVKRIKIIKIQGTLAVYMLYWKNNQNGPRQVMLCDLADCDRYVAHLLTCNPAAPVTRNF